MIKQIAKSELFKTYAGAIAILLGALPAVGSLVVSVVTAYRGEPYAEKTWTTLRKQVDEQSSAINAINLKLTKMEALQEGLQLGKIQGELEALQKQYDRLRREKKEKVSTKKCPPGQISIDNKCSTAPASVSPESKEELDQKQKQHLEDTQRLLKDYLKQQKTSDSKKTVRPLSPLPANP
jgi:prefoldin subunit 5